MNKGFCAPEGGWGVPVAESVLAPPGPIPNPVVTRRSAGEYCGGDPAGGEAAAGPPAAAGRGETSVVPGPAARPHRRPTTHDSPAHNRPGTTSVPGLLFASD